MKTIDIKIPTHTSEYPIIIGTDLISNLTTHFDLTKYSKIFIITDVIIAQHWLTQLKANLIATVGEEKIQDSILVQGEKEKTIETVKELWTEMQDARLDRKSLVINLGGGVITDMGGFAASTYMRGIDFMQIPTTLLAMVDASVGGKVGINFEGIKNLIGSFQQPIGVVIDIDTLKTLPDREFHSGFAEIIKHGLIYDKFYFEKVTTKKPREYSQEELIDIINGSCEIKAKVVQIDEHENGLRKILNFGHTIGHAIEILSAETDIPVLHGEAISVGMVGEAKISELMGYISEKDLRIIEEVFMNANLPTKVKELSKEDILNKLFTDKKNTHGKIKWTLLKKIGEADYNIQIGDNYIEKAIDYILHL